MKLIYLYLVCLLFTACTSLEMLQPSQPAYQARFEASKETVWTAVSESMKSFPQKTADRDEGFIETKWVEGYSDRPFGVFEGGLTGGQWKRRIKLLIRVTPLGPDETELKLISRVQEKAPGGTQAFQWRRVHSEGKLEEAIFQDIQEKLGSFER